MNWKLKGHVMAVLSRLPGGHRAYHLLQRLMGTNRMSIEKDISKALEILDMIHIAGQSAEGRVFLEIGTGWRPFVPFVLYLAGAKRILTLDINPWLTKAYAFETFRGLASELDSIAIRARVEETLVRTRYAAATPKTDSLLELLNGFHVEYVCPGDARTTGLDEASIDYVVSSNVFEHIPRDILRDIHAETHRILKPGGMSVHRFNPQDHYSWVDPSITGANFLQFSEAEWNWYGGSGLAFHNRLRCRQHTELFLEAGLIEVVNKVRVNGPAAEAIRNGSLSVHKDFAGFSPEELAGDYMWAAYQRPEFVTYDDRSTHHASSQDSLFAGAATC